MKIAKKILLGVSCMLLLGNTALAAAPAAETAPAPQQIEQSVIGIIPAPEQKLLVTAGKITAVDGNKITIKGEGNYPEVAVLVNDATYILDGKNGKEKPLQKLKPGKEVTVYYSPLMTRSNPPQTHAYAVVLGKNTPKLGKFFQVAQVLPGEDKDSVQVLNSNHDVVATISKDVYEDYRELGEGDSLMLWYDIMTMSMPGQTNAQKVVVLPPAETK